MAETSVLVETPPGVMTEHARPGDTTGARRPTRSGQEIRVVDAALRCIALWGVAKTTLDDVAREADWSRATVYRLFPGGKDAVLDAVVEVELERFFSALHERLAVASDLEDVLVTGMSEAAARITRHPALQFLVAHEPEVILPQISFARAERLLATAAAFAAPHLARWLGPEEANRVGEWVTRIIISYSASPSPSVDVADPTSVRRLVRSFVLPGIEASTDVTAGPGGRPENDRDRARPVN